MRTDEEQKKKKRNSRHYPKHQMKERRKKKIDVKNKYVDHKTHTSLARAKAGSNYIFYWSLHRYSHSLVLNE